MACGYVLCVCASTLTLLHLINSIFWDRSLDEQLYTCMKPHICARGRARVCARTRAHFCVRVCVCAKHVQSVCAFKIHMGTCGLTVDLAAMLYMTEPQRHCLPIYQTRRSKAIPMGDTLERGLH